MIVNWKNPAFLRILMDLVLLIPLTACVYSFRKIWHAPAKRGFFCNDETLQYPYRRDTISDSMLYKIGFYIPLSIILLWEILKFLKNYLKFKTLNYSIKELAATFLWQLYVNLLWLTFGLAAERLLKNIGKYTVARLRPHFFAVCQPYLTKDGSNCTDEKNHGVYIEDYECRKDVANVTQQMLHSMRLSFPSGHSSLACYGMMFLALYMHYQCQAAAAAMSSKEQHERRFKFWHIFNFPIILPALQLLCISVAWFVALSRLLDYKHHWSDVAAGCVLGSSVAIVVYRCYVVKHLKSVELHLRANSDSSATNTMNNNMTPATQTRATSVNYSNSVAQTIDMPMSSPLSVAGLKSTFNFSGKKANPNLQQVV